MTGLRRSGAAEMARRINAAVGLLAQGEDVVTVSGRLAKRYGLSARHARRYVERAAAGGRVDIPATKVVFTVKLSGDLVRRVRLYARQRDMTISAVVGEALQECLVRGGGGATARSRAGV